MLKYNVIVNHVITVYVHIKNKIHVIVITVYIQVKLQHVTVITVYTHMLKLSQKLSTSWKGKMVTEEWTSQRHETKKTA